MELEDQIREVLKKEAKHIVTPKEVKQKLFLQIDDMGKEGFFMKKRLVASIVAAALVIPTTVLAGPTLVEKARILLNLEGTVPDRSFTTQDEQSNYTTTNLYAEEVAANQTAQTALQTIHTMYPQTKNFEIAMAQERKGTQLGKELHDLTLIVKEKGKDFSQQPEEVTFTVDAKTGHITTLIHSKANADGNIGKLVDKKVMEMADQLLSQLKIDRTAYVTKIERTLLKGKDGKDEGTNVQVIFKPTSNELPLITVTFSDWVTAVAIGRS
ncbi:hypothetical protein P4V64_21650 [Bacillus thuringiensis]|nr:hypothetical protein [Bacillus thuringiensis]